MEKEYRPVGEWRSTSCKEQLSSRLWSALYNSLTSILVIVSRRDFAVSHLLASYEREREWNVRTLDRLQATDATRLEEVRRAMKRGGKEGEKGRNRDGGREGEKERERRGWTGWWRTAGRSSPFSLRQDTQVLSPIVFRCRLLHASLHRPATTPLRLHRQLVRKLSALVPGLFMPRWTTRQDAIRFARRLRVPCLGGSMVRELLKRNYRLLGKIPRGGWGIYRCLVDTVITDPISRGWK